ncbi:hypothetical protein AMTR_s00061p00117680 [Amborella trichopoda]|uniref:BZIP domain-containing protein n=1 Tax=Amborella trichopoda TaxID=13333 RepID=U5DA63_AMBTC|nr:hypothetical protein AMTR_s00061p00117680 [Amborella trichopoda]
MGSKLPHCRPFVTIQPLQPVSGHLSMGLMASVSVSVLVVVITLKLQQSANVRYCVNVNGNGMLGNVVPNESPVRQRRRIERAFDDLTERRQKRKTENRESAARSRARKQVPLSDFRVH